MSAPDVSKSETLQRLLSKVESMLPRETQPLQLWLGMIEDLTCELRELQKQGGQTDHVAANQRLRDVLSKLAAVSVCASRAVCDIMDRLNAS